MKFLNNLDLQKNEIQNFRVHNLAVAPSNPGKGQHYFNTVDNTEYCWNGEAWVDALSQGDYVFKNGIVEVDRTVTLDIATTTDIGGVIVGKNIDVDTTGKISIADATTEKAGVVRFATEEEIEAGTADNVVTSIKNVTNIIQNEINDGSIKEELDKKLNIEDIPDIKLSELTDDTDENPVKAAQTLDGLTTTIDELNEIHESGVKKADLEKLHGLTATAEEINQLHESGVTKEDLTKLHDVTLTADEINGIPDELDTKVDANEKLAEDKVGTFTKITFDEKGLVTKGEDLTADDIPDLSATYINVDQKGVAGGVATLGADGVVPAAQLPSFVDDVVELLTVSDTAPDECVTGNKYFNTTDSKIYVATQENTWADEGITPEADKIYVTIDENMSYRWGGTKLVQIGADKLLGYNVTITGDDVTTQFPIEHNLGTRNVVVEIYEAVAPYEKVYVNVLHTSATTITLNFAQPPVTGEEYKVTILAIG